MQRSRRFFFKRLALIGLAIAIAGLTLVWQLPKPAQAQTRFEPEQQIFTLSLLSNSVSGYAGNQAELQAELQQRVTGALADQRVQQAIGDWDVVWGPVVYTAPFAVFATNAMYVARQGNQYVIAIAGTNYASVYDWMIEDADVVASQQVVWPYRQVTGSNPKLSEGTDTGLQRLLAMEANEQTLIEFLHSIMRTSAGDTIQLIFTGHSLGGALAPTLALAIADQQSDWSRGNPFQMAVYPTAGPTPGNRDFATYYDQRLGPNTTRIWNSLDIVPHAWAAADLTQIPNLYEPAIPPNPLVKSFIKQLSALATGGDYQQILPT
ncbi:MAG: hypothetical protein AAGF24_10930, partial [Cyanobacteria bacterium P01_H01_bin.121]